MLRSLMVLLLTVCFAAGAGFVWLRSLLTTADRDERGEERQLFPSGDVLLLVEGKPVYQQLLGFERQLLDHSIQAALVAAEDTPAHATLELPHEPVALDERARITLEESFTASAVERKVLMEMVRRDGRFVAEDPKLTEACTARWRRADQAIHSLGHLSNPSELSTYLREKLCEVDLIEHYFDTYVLPTLSPTTSEIEQIYRDHAADYEQALTVVARQIVLANEAQAKHVHARVTLRNFAQMAKEHSIAPEALAGGLMTPIIKGGDMPRFFDVVFTVPVGVISQILKSPYGFHIILPLERIPARRIPLAEVREAIGERLKRERRRQAYHNWLELAMQTVTIAPPPAIF